MTFVTVFRRVPKPITGMIGTWYGPDFEGSRPLSTGSKRLASSSSSSIRPRPGRKSPSALRFSRSCPPRETSVYR